MLFEQVYHPVCLGGIHSSYSRRGAMSGLTIPDIET